MASRDWGCDSWHASGLVNLLGAGTVWATAKATILKGFTTAQQTDVGNSLEAIKTQLVALAALAYDKRGGDTNDVIGYTMSSPYQTYEDTTP
jgi:hypothetical protein